MTQNLINAFRSERLIYRAVEDTEEEKAWYHSNIESDPEALALGDFNLLRPQSRKRSDESLLDISKCLLGVIICIAEPDKEQAQSPPPPPPGETNHAGSMNSSSSSSTPPAPPKPTPIGFLTVSDETGCRHHHRFSALSISLAAAHRGKGYGSEALDWALDWAFSRANMHCVSLGCLEFNERGRRAYEKAGFVLEGRCRESHWHEGRFWDLLLYSMLEHEWAALRRARETGV